MSANFEQLQQNIQKMDGNRQLLGDFVDILFGKAGHEFLDEFDADTLLAIAQGALGFLNHKQPEEVKVRVYNPSFGADGWEADHTVLELGLTDRPFLVDSVRAELRRLDYKLFYLLHPIFRVRRDASGQIEQIAEREGKGVHESFELYLIEREDDPDKQQALGDAVREVIGDVILATDDYKLLREKSHEVSRYLRGLEQATEPAEQIEEYAAFIDWLDDDNYIFLGYREYEITRISKKPHLQLTEDSGLGILRKLEGSAYHQPVPISDIPEGLRERVTGGRVLTVTKTNAESTVHRAARMDYIGIKKLDNKGKVIGERRFVGLFTSKALSTAVEKIPILRRKLQQVLELDHAIPGSHDFKQIVSIFNTIPREELFWSDAERLHGDIRTIMGLAQERGVRLTVRPDPLARGLAVMVIMPRERFNSTVRRKIQHYLTETLQASHVDYQLAMGEDEEQVRFHFFYTTETYRDQVDIATLEREVAELTRTWDDHLAGKLTSSLGEMKGRRLAERYLTAFDERYKADTTAGVALRDINNLEALGDKPYRVDIVNPLHDEVTRLKIYHRQHSLVLSEVLPILENLGFRVLEQVPHVAHLPLQRDNVRGIDIFRVQDAQGQALDVRLHGERLTEALVGLLQGSAENDRLNRLVLYGGLAIREVALLRVYQMYYGQLNAVVSRRFINETLLGHPNIAKLLFDYFAAKFDPAVRKRETRMEELRASFLDSLSEVSSLPEDRTLRGLFNLMEATVRSNFFLGKAQISFKLESAQVETMPEPRPLFEIAVAGPGVEGTHLRGGLVARGGIRWSDRPDDFRTEVLGLMKTQMTKNAVIVPVGSKGGFVVKGAPTEREALRGYVQEQYQIYIRGLLDLTDNNVGGEVVHPEGLVIYDEPDPYLVVAADKGTATFSDLANETAAEYDFWLGDAFASGGSHGYDHKEQGITARGAWECVSRHFREMGVNVFEDHFTVAGIGDMSGDVFGNGMIYTDKIKLQAAFNHLHIFLDPDPDAAASFAERQRLFDLPRSSWEDYDQNLISEGGGIYSRYAKSIPLSPQIKEMLDVSEDALSGQDLIRAVLEMPVDLLWNGGIGTYVKASSERDAEVGDSNNDAVRTDADKLRAKVVGEGGNLGFTQLARIEYAKAGGRNNTDAIDNSAGVDMSDHEVNIKILLQPLVRSGDLSFVQRNRLLKEMTEEVNALVLRDNYSQSLCLSLAEARSRQDLLLFESLQDYLEERGDLSPGVEYLPGPRVYEERYKAAQGLKRPELAILLAYAKMGLYRRLLETDFPDQTYFQHYLFDYFPEVLQERFPEAIKTHSLGREIIATQFTNTVVDLLGTTFVHRSIRDTGATPVEVIKAALVALEMLDVNPLLARIFALDNKVPASAQYGALDELVRAVEGVVNWILLADLTVEPMADFVAIYREPLSELRRKLQAFLPEREKRRFDKSSQGFEQQGFPAELAAEVASLDYLTSGVGVVDVGHTAGVELDEAARHFYALGERLGLGWIRDSLMALPSVNQWETIALGGLVMDLRQVQRQLTIRYFRAVREGDKLSPEAFLEAHPRLLKRYDQSLKEIRSSEGLGLASGGVLSRLLFQMLEESTREAVAA